MADGKNAYTPNGAYGSSDNKTDPQPSWALVENYVENKKVLTKLTEEQARLIEAHKKESEHRLKLLRESEAEVERLRAGFESEEEQTYVHNVVTGLHNVADLEHIATLEAALQGKETKIETLRAALQEIAEEHDYGYAQDIAQEALDPKV